jgi:hypothetical protein
MKITARNNDVDPAPTPTRPLPDGGRVAEERMDTAPWRSHPGGFKGACHDHSPPYSRLDCVQCRCPRRAVPRLRRGRGWLVRRWSGGATNPLSQAWLELDGNSPAPGAAQDFSFDTPLDAADASAKLGRVVYTDMHVGATPPGVAADYASDPHRQITPTGCADRDLTPQEKAMEFTLFNLSSCVTPPTPDGGTTVTLPPIRTRAR